jgi:excisionase family DNA binding protein
MTEPISRIPWRGSDRSPPALDLEPIIDAIAEAVTERVVQALGGRSAHGGYLNADQAAEYLACDRRHVYELVSQRRVRVHRDGRRVLFLPEELDAALEIEEAP